MDTRWMHRGDLDWVEDLYHDAGMRAASVHRGGHDITDTVHPDEWPEPWRSDFYDRRWRPWTPPGVTPVWWSAVDEDDRAWRRPDRGRGRD